MGVRDLQGGCRFKGSQMNKEKLSKSVLWKLDLRKKFSRSFEEQM